MSEGTAGDYKQVALAFTKALAARDYEAAYALTSRAYRDGTSQKAMADAFEAIVPLTGKALIQSKWATRWRTGRAGSRRTRDGST